MERKIFIWRILYQIRIEPTAQKELKKLPRSDREKAARSTAESESNPGLYG